MDFDLSVVADEAHFTEFVHEETHAGSGRAYHLSQRFLTDIGIDGCWGAFLAEIREQEKKPRETLFA